MSKMLYFDTSSTTRVYPDVVKAMNKIMLNDYGNPSSQHAMGDNANKLIISARKNIAKNLGAKKLINLSNIDYVYDSDPKKNPNAKKIEQISWAEYRKIIPKEWISGLNSPFDPTASEIAEKEGIQVIIMNGKPIDNLAKCLNGEKFLGTVIS